MNAYPLTTNEWRTSEELDVAPEALLFELRMESFCQAFLSDAASAWNVIRTVIASGTHPANSTRIYQQTIVALMGCPDFALPVPSCAFSANIAWLLKDVAELTYAQIADVLQISTMEVARKIHEAREVVLATVSDAL